MKVDGLKAPGISTSLLILMLVSTNLVAATNDGNERLAQAASAAVDRITREDGFSGAVLVAHGNTVLIRKAAGLSDRENRIPNTPETKFPLESVTKQFTAAAILLLLEDGKLSLSDSVSKY